MVRLDGCIIMSILRDVHRWNGPALGFCLYTALFLAGAVSDSPALNIAGASLMFMTTCLMGWRRIARLRAEPAILVAASIVAAAILTWAANAEDVDTYYLVKYIYVFLFYIIVSSLGLRPMSTVPARNIFLACILGLAFASAIVGRTYGEYGRLSGVFVNPNTLSLIALSILFLIDDRHDPLYRKVAMHGLILILLLYAGTCGAILAYAFGLALRFVLLHNAPLMKRAKYICLLILVLAVLYGVWLSGIDSKISVIGRLGVQMEVIKDQLWLAISGYSVDYGQLADTYGGESLSGAWRIAHWRNVLGVFFSGNTLNQLLGFGSGASYEMEKLPHNDYLRILFEYGFVGFSLTIGFYILIVRHVPRRHLYVLAVVACYAFTENIIDNLMFMSLFVLWLATCQSHIPGKCDVQNSYCVCTSQVS